MIPRLTDDQRQAIKQGAGAPVYFVDSATNASDVQLCAEDYEKRKAQTEPDDVWAISPLFADIAPEGWEDASNEEKQP